MGLTDDEIYELHSHGSQNDPWDEDAIAEFMAISSGDAWVVICPG